MFLLSMHNVQRICFCLQTRNGHYLPVTVSITNDVSTATVTFTFTSDKFPDGLECVYQTKETFDYKFVSRAQKRLFHELGEDEYLEHKRRLRQIIVFIKHNFYALVLGSSPLRRRESFTEEENRLMDECHDRIIEHIGLILDHIKSDGPSRLTCKHFIAKEYWPSEE